MTNQTTISASRRLILHLGVQKTGSTSLHRFLGRNRTALEHDLVVRTPVKGSPMRALGQAAIRYSLTPTPESRAALAAAAHRVRSEIPEGDQPVLVSHENLPGAMLGNGGTTTLYPEIEAILGCVAEVFAPMRLEIAVYTRAMTAWKQSVYGQAVRSDGYTGTRAEFMEATRDCGSWDDLKRRLVDAFGADRVRVFRLEDELDDMRPGQQLLRLSGLGDTRIAALDPINGRSNPAMNAGALEFLRLLNGLDLDRTARRAVVDLVRKRQSLFTAAPA